jgi:hypothetical protein
MKPSADARAALFTPAEIVAMLALAEPEDRFEIIGSLLICIGRRKRLRKATAAETQLLLGQVQRLIDGDPEAPMQLSEIVMKLCCLE